MILSEKKSVKQHAEGNRVGASEAGISRGRKRTDNPAGGEADCEYLIDIQL